MDVKMDELSTDNTLVRKPEVSAPEKNEKMPQKASIQATEHTISESDKLPSEYAPLGEMPLAGKYLEAGPAYNTFEVKSQLAEIDEFVLAHTEDNKDSYKDYLNKLLEQAGIDEPDIYTKLDKLTDWIGIQRKLENALKEKEEFEAKDPLEMTSEELKRYINGRY